MRYTLLALLGMVLAAPTVFGAPRHEPVVVVTPPKDGLPLLTRTGHDRPQVRTFTRSTGVRPFIVPSVRPGVSTVPESGPARFGVYPDEADNLIAVRTREPLPTLLISPYENINDRTRSEIRRSFPYARRVDTITDDLRRAQRQYLRDQGAILQVRSFRPTTARTIEVAPASKSPRVLGPDEDLGITSTRVIRTETPVIEQAQSVQDETKQSESEQGEAVQSPE